MFIKKFILILYNVEISGNDASRIYHSLLLQKPIRKQHWKPKNLKRKDSVSKNQLRVTYSLGDLEKAGWKQASKKKLMAITGILFFIFLTSKLQLLTSDAETLAIFRLCDTSKSGSISARVSWREVKKSNFQCDTDIFWKFAYYLSILKLWSISPV